MADPLTDTEKIQSTMWNQRTAVFVRQLATSAIDLVLPPLCLSCQSPVGYRDNLCAQCWSEIDFITPPLCDRLGIPMPFGTGETMISAAAAARPPNYHRARAVARYSGVMRNLIHDFKFHDQHQARNLFTRWLATAGKDLIADADIIVPVPLNRFRLLERRFNQSAILAKSLSHTTDLPFHPTLLSRVRRTKSQIGLTSQQRRKNVNGAFAVSNHGRTILADKKVLLLDDVITTGATSESCAKALYKAGVAQVDVLALALVMDINQMTT